MSYIVDVNNFAVSFLPTKKRFDKYKAWVKVLLQPLQVLYNTMFGTYKNGSIAADWDVSTNYVVGDQVKYIDKSVYECWVNSSAGILPTNTDYWFKIQDKFVGIEPRMKYTAQRLSLEYALNEWFGTTFVNTPGASDIYIDPNLVATYAFYVGATESNSSLVVYEEADVDAYIQAVDVTTVQYYFYIYIPIAVSDALTNEPPDSVPDISPNREKIVRQLADLYVYAGISYAIKTY